MRYWLLLLMGAGFIAWGCAPDIVIARDRAGSSAGESAAGEAAGGAGSAGEASAGSGQAGEGAAAGTASLPEPEPESLVLADSVADFSLSQGKRGWYYGFDSGTLESFALLTRTAVIAGYVPASGDTWDCWTTTDPHWTQIFQLGAHPNGTDSSGPSTAVLERAVRRWQSNFRGDVRILGELAKIDVTPGGSNGVAASILVDGVMVYSYVLGGEDGAGLSYETSGTVDIGSTIDFVLDPHQGADHHDLTRFTAVIERALSQPG